ncbi:MAG: sigma factor [Candidatus Saccharibacteria bacterium]
MEKLYKLRSGIKAKHALKQNSQKTKGLEFNQLPNVRLMELFTQIKKGNQQAIETLSIRYIQLVIGVAGDFKGNGLTDLELILKGTSGLIKAAENFDHSRGIEFDAYAMWSVRQQLIQAIDEYEYTRPLPLNKIGLLSKKKFFNQNPSERVNQLL